MKLSSTLRFLNASLDDLWRMHDFNYQLPPDNLNEYWDEECIQHPTNSHCKIYED